MMLLKIAFQLLIKVFTFTGIWLASIITFVLHKTVVFIQEKTGAEIIAGNDIYALSMIILFCLIVAYVTTQNTTRLVSQRSDFNIIRSIIGNNQKKREMNSINPNVPKEYLATTPLGFHFGRKDGNYVMKPETTDGHILVISGAGSGKSSCIAIPSLLSWQERVFAIDIKGELSKKTESKRPNIKIFNPSSPNSKGYDPFYILKESRDIVQDIMQIVYAIVPLPENIKEPFFINSARNYFTGAMVYYYEMGLSFIQTIETIQITPTLQLIEEISNSGCHRAKLLTNQFIGIEQKTLAAVFTELSNHIMIFATDQEIKAALSKKDIITPKDLENGFDIYLSIEESKLDIWKNLLTLIVNQFLKHFERRPDEGAIPVLFLLDEFARLGKVETVINGLATLRSKKITINILTQSLAQLDAIYGKEQRQVIADNCQFKAILNATDADTQDYFSRLVGTYDKEKKSRNSNFEQYTGLGKGRGVSETTEEKRIIKPEEFGRLKDIVILSPMGYFRVDKAPYYLQQ